MTGVPGSQRQLLVVVPAHPPGPYDAGDTVRFELRHVAGGTQVLPVFSTVAGLVRELGPRQAAGTFGTESVTLWTVMSPDGPEGTGGGSPRFDEALAQLLGAIGERHLQLAAAIAAHGRKLREAGKHYQTAEESVGRMVDRIMDEGQPGTARS